MEDTADQGNPYPFGVRITYFFYTYWATIIVTICPIIFMPIMICNNFEPKFNCLYVLCVMATCWITEGIPLPVTSLMPIFFFPLLGVMSSSETCRWYFTDAVALCLGTMLMAIAIEYCNLHKRVAYAIMSRVGCSHPKLHASFAAVTTFISMWITNTATTALMCPIVMAILVELENQGVSKVYINRIASGPDANLGKQDLPDDPIPTKLTVSYFLVIAFSSTVGGTSTIIGTGTNMMLKGAYETLYPDSDVSFVYWMILFLPPMIINAVLMELGLQFIFFGLWRKNSDAAKAIHIDEETRNSIKQVIKRKYADLGPITWHECMIISIFLLMILLFFIRHPDFMPGYVRLFNRHLNRREQALYIRDSAAVMLLFVIMFFIPKTLDVLNFFKKRPKTLPEGSEDPLVTWKFLAGRMPWGFILLLGSSYALAQGSLVSGMNDYLAEKLKHLAAVPLALLLLLVLIFIKILTEFISNVAVASITLPILNTMSQNLQVNPLYFMLPATIVASYCFLMPVGTPPNTILRTTYHIKPRQMLKGGLWTSFITLFITWTMFLFYSSLIYKDLLSFPRWAEIKDAENVEAFLLFVRNLIVQSRHSGGLRGEAFTINDIIYNETDYSLYALNWGDNLSFETSLS